MIALNDIRFQYDTGDFQLCLSRLNIDRGCTAAFIGPSGSGKTTLLHLICGIIRPQQGHVVVDGVEVNQLSDRPRRAFRIINVGLVFQEFELLEYLSVIDNILLPYRITGALTLDRLTVNRAKQLAEQVGLSDKGGRRPRQLSQGERQRVAVCRALLAQPKLLLSDEPTGNLDPSNKGRVLDILFDYARSAQATFLMVTHDHDLLSRFDRVIDCQDWTVPSPDRRPENTQDRNGNNNNGGCRER